MPDELKAIPQVGLQKPLSDIDKLADELLKE
jgi:hypothetical protein